MKRLEDRTLRDYMDVARVLYGYNIGGYHNHETIAKALLEIGQIMSRLGDIEDIIIKEDYDNIPF